MTGVADSIFGIFFSRQACILEMILFEVSVDEICEQKGSRERGKNVM